MALTVKISILLYGLTSTVIEQAESGDLTESMAAEILKTVRNLERNFEGKKTGD